MEAVRAAGAEEEAGAPAWAVVVWEMAAAACTERWIGISISGNFMDGWIPSSSFRSTGF